MAAVVEEKYLKERNLKPQSKQLRRSCLESVILVLQDRRSGLSSFLQERVKSFFLSDLAISSKKMWMLPSSSFSTRRKLHAAREQGGRINNIDQSEMRSHASDAAPVTDSHAWKAEILLKDSFCLVWNGKLV